MTASPAAGVATAVGGKTMSPSPVELPESTPSSPILATPARDREVDPRGVTELTPELRAALPTSPLASWSARDVAACVRVLGREFAGAEEGESRSGDVEAFDRYADTFLAHGIDGEKLSCVTIAQLSGVLGVRSYEHRFKVVEWVKRYLEDELMSSPGSIDTPSPAADGPDAKDRAIANLTVKLSDMQMALSALEGTSEPRVASEPDENLTAALAEANERLFRFSKDATEAHEAMLAAMDEKEKLASALETYEALVPTIRSSNDALREDTLAALARMRAEFTDAVARVRAETERTVASLEAEKSYQESRNGALLLRNRQLYHRIQDFKGSIRVYTRIRPVAANDTSGDGAVVAPGRCLDPAAEGEDVVCRPPVGKLSNTGERRPAGRRVEEKRYSFDRVFGPDSTQAQVYEELSPLVTSILDGYNVCVFAYGQTGSGKTFTMGGCTDAGAEGDVVVGVNARALAELFETAEARGAADGTTFAISVEMREIYNEQVRDLLNPTEKESSWKGGSSGARLASERDARERDRQKPGDRPGDRLGDRRRSAAAEEDDAPTVTRVEARDAAHVLEIMAEGTARRASAGTALNERSSRSHSVVTVFAEGVDGAGRVVSGRLHLIDLAGSERVARSEATGDRLKEAQHINKSLSALGDVIAALLEKRAHVPFRNSQLTRLLSDSLGGNSKVVLLAHLAPEAASLPETQSTLLFGQRCSQVELGKARVNVAGGSGSSAADSALASSLAKCRRTLEEERARASAAEAEAAALRAEIEAMRANAETRAVVGANHTARGARSTENVAGTSAAESAAAREPLSPIARTNSWSQGSSATPVRPQSAAKRAISRVAAHASSTILREY